ncbi:MAG: hypothetical protein H7X89_10375 [Rhizobiales bacterium]|nr:hypothetical protein [Hyphomicrobiales bacterium]
MPVETVTNIGGLSGFVDYVRDGEALGALILAIAATLAWIFNKYYAYLYWRHTKDIEIIENLIALNTEIVQNTKSFRHNFTLRTYRHALANARAMTYSRERQPMITAEAGENAVFNSIKSRLTILPTDIIEPVIAYYTKEAEFTASYASLSNPILAKRHIEITLTVIRTTHLDAIKCIKQGKATSIKIADKIRELNQGIQIRIAANAALGIVAIAALLATVRW